MRNVSVISKRDGRYYFLFWANHWVTLLDWEKKMKGALCWRLIHGEGNKKMENEVMKTFCWRFTWRSCVTKFPKMQTV